MTSDERRYRTEYRLRLSCLYHQQRERFFTRLDKTLSVLLLASATAASATFFKLLDMPAWAGALASVGTTLLALVQLFFDFAGRARHHTQKAADFKRLQAHGERLGAAWTDTQCNEMAALTLEAEAGEPASMSALVAHCQNILAVGADASCVRLLPHERWLMNWIDFDAVAINSRKRQPNATAG
jgi:hypothetical protein